MMWGKMGIKSWILLNVDLDTRRKLGFIGMIICAPILFICFVGISSQEKAYSFEDYRTDITIYEDKQCTVSEQFYVSNPYSVDVKRYLPFCSNIEKPDGTKGRYHLAVSELECRTPEDKNVGRLSTVLNIPLLPQIDSVSGKEKCELTYSAHLSSDYEQDDNQLFFNIIGNKNEISIFGVEFSIEMPSEVSRENIQFYLVREDGKLVPLKLDFDIKGKVIKGEYPGELKSKTGICVMMELEDGYFKVSGQDNGRIYRLTGMVLLVFLLCAAIWYLFGRDKYVVMNTTELGMPLGMNALELGYYYKGALTMESVFSMFYTLAGKGYLNIMKRKDAKDLKPAFTVSKIRDYDGDNPLEKYFMNCIFGKSFIVQSEELMANISRFRGSLKTFFMDAEEYLGKEKPVYRKNYRWFILIVVAGMIVNYLLAFLMSGENYLIDEKYWRVMQGMETVSLAVFMGCIAYFIMVRGKIGFDAISYFILSFSILYFTWLPELIFDTAHIILYLTGMITLLIEVWFAFHFKRRTERAMIIAGRAAGYRKFLMNIESSRIDALRETDKDKYYEAVASAYALKVNWKWFKDVENIIIPIRGRNEVF
ncbi:MAG: DUF2207 domain-containing protein [Lachnospiraceae bacterium]|nr:DUF2207 domain-containing protein [Lachnospiraceae bacterium]